MLASSLCPPSCCPPGLGSQPSSSHPSSAEDKARGSCPSLTCLIDHCSRAVYFLRQLLSWIPGTSTGITGQMGKLALPRWRVTKKNYYSEFVTRVPDCMCRWPNYVNCPEYFIFRNKRGRSVHAAFSHLVGLSFPLHFSILLSLNFNLSINVWRKLSCKIVCLPKRKGQLVIWNACLCLRQSAPALQRHRCDFKSEILPSCQALIQSVFSLLVVMKGGSHCLKLAFKNRRIS